MIRVRNDLQNIGSNNFIRIYSSHFTLENLQEKAQRTHTPHADIDILQNLCINSAFRSGLIEGTRN